MTPVIQSTRLGWGRSRFDHTQVRVFRADAPLRCQACGACIPKSAVFVRRTRFGATGRGQHQSLPTCRGCYPFDVVVKSAR